MPAPTVFTRIAGLAMHVPQRVLTNAELETMVETSDEWIVSRTGIRERHIAAPGEAASDLAAAAADKALRQAGIPAQDVTHVVCATMTPDSLTPATACNLAAKLDLPTVPAFDVSAACSGFLYGLETARALLALHPQATVLLAASEVMSSRLDWTDRNTCVLFGDGAAAAVLRGQGPGWTVDDLLLASDGRHGKHLTILGGGSAMPYSKGQTVDELFFLQMNGREVFKHAVRNMTSACKDVLARNGLTTADVDLVVGHQANKRILSAVGEKLELPEDKVFINLDKYGNTSAASIGLALSEVREQGLVPAGGRVLLAAMGGGFTWGAGLLGC